MRTPLKEDVSRILSHRDNYEAVYKKNATSPNKYLYSSGALFLLAAAGSRLYLGSEYKSYQFNLPYDFTAIGLGLLGSALLIYIGSSFIWWVSDDVYSLPLYSENYLLCLLSHVGIEPDTFKTLSKSQAERLKVILKENNITAKRLIQDERLLKKLKQSLEAFIRSNGTGEEVDEALALLDKSFANCFYILDASIQILLDFWSEQN